LELFLRIHIFPINSAIQISSIRVDFKYHKIPKLKRNMGICSKAKSHHYSESRMNQMRLFLTLLLTLQRLYYIERDEIIVNGQ
jgi:hypothetical protein